ncbi:hypothetical protein OPQ81_008577 [Rhizoctonia solani]|nr:hypothetical protein OPQ81_008577 [Rhizoctonia solani]
MMTQIALNDQDVRLKPRSIEAPTEWGNMNVPTRRSRLKFPKRKIALTILLIGETGSGKTSFMSLLLNLFQGNGPFELKDKHFLDSESGLDLSQSKTTEPRLYSFTTSNGIKMEILDTPGLDDTRGIKKDQKHVEKTYCAIQELVTRIDGVMIIANGTVQRLTLATDYTLNILATMFPRSILENIGIIFYEHRCKWKWVELPDAKPPTRTAESPLLVP